MIEHNVVHHQDDDGIDNAASSNTVVRHNIVYKAKATLPSGDGNGIKLGVGTSYNHTAQYNILFDNAAFGLQINLEPDETQGTFYHNLAYRNNKGISGYESNSFVDVRNNVAFRNIQLEGGNLIGDPKFVKLGLLDIDTDGNDNADIFDACESNLPNVKATINCFKDATRQIFSLDATSPARNTGALITGVNDQICQIGEYQNCYLENAPDIGANEYNPGTTGCITLPELNIEIQKFVDGQIGIVPVTNKVISYLGC